MKKKLWTKLVLAIMAIAMIASLAACSKKTPVVETPVPVVETTGLIDELVNIIESVGPLVTTLNSIEETSTVGLDAGIGVDYNFGTENAGNYSIGLKGNIKASDPEAEITVKDNTLTTDDAKNLFLLSYKGGSGMAYVKEPFTTINTVANTPADTTSADLTAIKSDINIIMDVLMYEIAKTSISIKFDELGASIRKLVSDFSLTEESLSSLITLTPTEAGNKLTIPAASAKTIIGIAYGMIASTADMESIIDTVINTLLPEAKNGGYAYIKSTAFTFPNIIVEATVTSGAISAIKIGFDYVGLTDTTKTGQYGKLYIDLNKFSVGETVTVAAPSYVTKSLQIGVGADMIQKGFGADLTVNVTGNMANQSNVLVNAVLALNNNNTLGSVNGFYNGALAYLDIAGAYTAVGQTTENNLYSAEYNMYTEMSEALTKWSTDVKTPATTNNPVTTGESLSLMQQIYKMLGGDVDALVVTDNVKADPTPTEMLTALDDKIGNYVRFDIPTTGYADVINVLKGLWTTNETTVKGIVEEVTPWAEVETLTDWVGNLYLTKEGINNDLLDIVNIFVCNYENGAKEDIDVEFLTDFCNKYLAILAITSSELSNVNVNVAAYKAAVKVLDEKLLYAKNVYNYSNHDEAAETAYKNAKTAHTEALKFANGLDGIASTPDDNLTANYFANLVMTEIFGYTGTTGDYLADFINSGVTGKAVCQKDGGLIGGIQLWGKTNTAETQYVGINGFIKVVEKNVSDLGVATTGGAELTEATTTTAEKYVKYAEWGDGTKKLNMAIDSGCTETNLVYLYQDANGLDVAIENAVYDKQYANLETLQDGLWDLLEYYKDIVKAVA